MEFEQKIVPNDAFVENEISTNKTVFFIILALCFFAPLNEFLNHLDTNRVMSIVNQSYFMPASGALLILDLVAAVFKFRKKWIKYMLLFGLTALCAYMFFLFSLFAVFMWLIPIMVSIRYFERRMIIRSSIVTLLFFLTTAFLGVRLDQTNEMIASLHDYCAYNYWESTLDTVAYVVIPVTVTFIFCGFFAHSVANSGYRLLSNQYRSMMKITALDTELKMASDIQLSVLPQTDYDDPDGSFSIRAYEKTAKVVGGDFYDYLLLEEHVVAVLIADVSDKGFPAAMFMMAARQAIRCALKCSHSLSEAIHLANDLICSDNHSDMFLTLWLCLFDLHTGVGKFVNAGHLPPILKHSDGSTEQLENDPDLFLGNFPDCPPAEHLFQMKEGDVLLLYTDGLTDSLNEAGESYGSERLLDCVRKAPADAQKLRDQLINEVETFSQKVEQFDDTTIVTLQCGKLLLPRHESWCVPIGTEGTQVLMDRVQTVLKENGCPETACRDVGVITDEMCSNGSEHAYASGEGMIWLDVDIGDNFIDLVFSNSGEPFDPLEHILPPKNDEFRFGGLGLHLIYELSDSMEYEYNEGRNILKIRKIWKV